MTIKNINEVKNPVEFNLKPIKERMDINIPGIINENIPRRNGGVYVLTGSGGSGKSSLLMNMFKSKSFYRNIFNNIFYICPSSSFQSVDKHPFEKHDKVYHELTVELLDNIYNQLIVVKENATRGQSVLRIPPKSKKKIFYDNEEGVVGDVNPYSEDEEDHQIQYSCVIIDDMASSLKDNSINKQLNKMIIKSRHICCSFIITLQNYYYFPKILRRQLTYITIFKPQNIESWNNIADELLNMNKDDALTLFNYVFDKQYNHLDVDLINNIYYKNFNKLEIN
jgi:hypothetical protein